MENGFGDVTGGDRVPDARRSDVSWLVVASVEGSVGMVTTRSENLRFFRCGEGGGLSMLCARLRTVLAFVRELFRGASLVGDEGVFADS